MFGNGSRVSTHKNGWFQSFRCKRDPHIVAWGPVLAIDSGDTALLECRESWGQAMMGLQVVVINTPKYSIVGL